MLFCCRNITKRYLGESVVEDINLELDEGGIISLIGPSGVGKTTLFNVLAGVDAPDEGEVLLSGETISGVSGKVSYMMQKDLLLEYRTALDNAILPLVLRGIKKKDAREAAAAFFPRFGLAGCEKKYPRQMSGGMRQRAALLRTCLQHYGDGAAQPSVILLDEPFSALDAITRREMQAWFQEIAAAFNFAAVFITHDIDEAITLSDTVYVMTGKPGKITGIFDVPVPRPRGDDFSVSGEFMAMKKMIYRELTNAPDKMPVCAGKKI